MYAVALEYVGDVRHIAGAAAADRAAEADDHEVIAFTAETLALLATGNPWVDRIRHIR